MPSVILQEYIPTYQKLLVTLWGNFLSSDLQFTGKETEAYKGEKSNLHVVDKQVIIDQIFRDHRNLLMVIVMNGPKAVVTDAYLAAIGF